MREEIVRDFLARACGITEYLAEAQEAGSNNLVYLVTLPEPAMSSCSSFILRIYNNGYDLDRVTREHEILEVLNEVTLPFFTPCFKRDMSLAQSVSGDVSKIEANGNQLANLHMVDNILASMFEVIPGKFPQTADLNVVREMGKATGHLMIQLNAIYHDFDARRKSSEIASSKLWSAELPWYWDIWRAHKAITRNVFYSYMNSSSLFQNAEEHVNYILSELVEVERKIMEWKNCDFPVSFVHGDLVADNFLCGEEGRVTAILDFEFIGKDWRVMDLATALSKFPGSPNGLQSFGALLEGYAQAGGKLTPDEKRELPRLVALRIMNNVAYFVGRIVSKEVDSPECLHNRLGDYCRRLTWLKDNEKEIASIIDALL